MVSGVLFASRRRGWYEIAVKEARKGCQANHHRRAGCLGVVQTSGFDDLEESSLVYTQHHGCLFRSHHDFAA